MKFFQKNKKKYNENDVGECLRKDTKTEEKNPKQ